MRTGSSARMRRIISCRWIWEARPTIRVTYWPKSRMTADGWNADVKDELEAILARQVFRPGAAGGSAAGDRGGLDGGL